LDEKLASQNLVVIINQSPNQNGGVTKSAVMVDMSIDKRIIYLFQFTQRTLFNNTSGNEQKKKR